MEYFINFSGGVDSTYYLWRWLKENPNKKIFVHHCLLFKNRREVEKIATDNILRYFRDNGLPNFEYTETEFSKKGIKATLYDIEPIYFLAGLILKSKSYNSIQHILFPVCFEEVHGTRLAHLRSGRPWSQFKDKNTRTYKIMLYCNTVAGRTFEYHSPYYNKTKKQMIQEMPRELFEMTWYCRAKKTKPVDNKPCNNCFNCNRVQGALKEIDK